MRRLLWLLYQPYKLLVFVPLLMLSTAFFGGLVLVLLMILDARRVSFVCGVGWARLNAWLTPMLVRVSGRENIDPKQSYVVVSNHQSHYDVLVLYGWLGVDFKWVMKQELRKVPGLGAACEALGHIFIDRSSRNAAVATIEAAKNRITGGTSVVFFPEGTRSRDGQLGAFKKGAFRMACDLGVPILPVTILGTRTILPPETKDLFPGRARMIIHPPVPVDDSDDEDLTALIERVRTVISAPLESPSA
jgi:1-acyl-sn-glycerol-3-phosphate acyltransferase